MQKLIAVLLLGLALAFLSGCGNGEPKLDRTGMNCE